MKNFLLLIWREWVAGNGPFNLLYETFVSSSCHLLNLKCYANKRRKPHVQFQ